MVASPASPVADLRMVTASVANTLGRRISNSVVLGPASG
jgi:hypothetical protein